ncbi:hypothetical protein BDV25DRAFT_149191 [Aspergillus avenaceus]|uniref:Transferase family-domain-containing protein n=1 Tax=Aspergillus avenaceus TaxID=36643 RepID=A0A5N6U4X8_ASPAV|nr:hypothetical protein BDV25DRAFT_149191 [Aspergillus avenaceus]
MGFFKSKPDRPTKIPTDTVVPVAYWDQQKHSRAACLHFTYRFEDVLSKDELRSSLNRLFDIGNWHRLGARLRENDNGRLEYHIPAQYDEVRPRFEWTTSDYPMEINEHPLAERFPKATSHPSIASHPQDIKSLCVGPNCPDRLDDWIYSDRPQLVIHVSSFNDATLLSVTFMHTLMDAMGIASFLKAWSAVLRGKEDEVPIFNGIGDYPLELVNNKTPKEDFIHTNLILRGFSMLLFIICFVFELIWYSHEEPRIVCIPGHFVDELHTQALSELADEKSEESRFVSESDVLLSWWTKVTIKALNPSPHRMVTLMNTFDIRSNDLGQPGSNNAFITNAVLASYTFLRCHDILHKPLSYIASQIRQSLVLQRTERQTQALLALEKESVLKNGHLPPLGDSTCILFAFSNWHKNRLFDIDFAPAVARPGIPPNERANGLGRPSYVIPLGRFEGLPLRNMGPVAGKDPSGNWWIMWTLRKQAWSGVEKELDALEWRKIQ